MSDTVAEKIYWLEDEQQWRTMDSESKQINPMIGHKEIVNVEYLSKSLRGCVMVLVRG
jgi:hypothetical protein